LHEGDFDRGRNHWNDAFTRAKIVANLEIEPTSFAHVSARVVCPMQTFEAPATAKTFDLSISSKHEVIFAGKQREFSCRN
jgi:hypothetical protein